MFLTNLQKWQYTIQSYRHFDSCNMFWISFSHGHALFPTKGHVHHKLFRTVAFGWYLFSGPSAEVTLILFWGSDGGIFASEDRNRVSMNFKCQPLLLDANLDMIPDLFVSHTNNSRWENWCYSPYVANIFVLRNWCCTVVIFHSCKLQ